MKRLTDYTNKELSMLTEEKIAKLIDIECMSEGVPLSITPKPILKEIPEIQKPTTEVFSVDNYYFTNLGRTELNKSFVENKINCR